MDKNFGPDEFNRFIGKPDGMDDEAVLDVDDVNAILRRALGNNTIACDDCGGICYHQAVRMRDAFMRRGRALGIELAHGVDLYQASREFGIAEPADVIEKIYELWCELWVLYRFLEPQDRLLAVEEEGASPLEE